MGCIFKKFNAALWERLLMIIQWVNDITSNAHGTYMYP